METTAQLNIDVNEQWKQLVQLVRDLLKATASSVNPVTGPV